jgi:peptidoglycan/xylan/chitin deacetylase (PgdA/CDA1 family)
MLTFRRFTILFFLLLLTLNFWNILTPRPGGFVQAHDTLLYALLFVTYFGISGAMAFLPCSGFHHPVNCSGSGDQQAVAITFDDGPDRLKTPVILDLLKKHNVPAAFFCIGHKLPANDELTGRIVSEGHLIGNHSFSHSKWFDFFTATRIKKELLATNQLVRKITGRSPLLFRPPFGVVNPMVSRALRSTNLQAVCWNIRSYDTILQDPVKVLQRILRRLQPGAVILLHDHTAFSESHLEQLILGIRAAGYEIKPLDQLLNLQAYES